ncbi:hypothetical protein FKW77_008932 [Venturia effusa]|uniref:N-acetyltransferase domain-containing protein n=1 Tax=Venturia effusa TaxID=50376 RepID=A0A517L408_9PEZI|nr:hypothetical protein FKW77_008932 [Venturia effusa]
MVQTSIATWLTRPNPQKQHDIQLKEETISSEDTHNPSPPAASISISAHDEPASRSLHEENDVASDPSPKRPKANFRLKALPLPPDVSMAAVTSEYISAYMRMTALLLPIPYPKKFFEEIIEDPDTASICLIALWAQNSGNDQQNPTQKVVSGIRCRLLTRSLVSPPANNQADDPERSPTLYIAALTTLAPYRGYGLASALFKRVLSRAIRQHGITTVTAHRWEANDEAESWYKSHGFKEVGFVHDYYRRLKPSGAFVLERRIGPQDLLGGEVEEEEDQGINS